MRHTRPSLKVGSRGAREMVIYFWGRALSLFLFPSFSFSFLFKKFSFQNCFSFLFVQSGKISCSQEEYAITLIFPLCDANLPAPRYYYNGVQAWLYHKAGSLTYLKRVCGF